MRLILVIFVAALCLTGCKKEPPPPGAPDKPEPVTPVSPQDTECKAIPPPPAGFYWRDSTGDVFKDINAFFHNPLNGDEVIVIVNGNLQGSNQMMAVNLVSKSTRFLANLDQYLPSVNSAGWILFSTVDDHVYRIKANGDSLTQLTQLSGTHDPKWDFTGKHFYYLQDQFSTFESRLYRASSSGVNVNSWLQDLPWSAPFHKSNKIVVQARSGNVVTLYLADNTSSLREALVEGPFDSQKNQSHFRYLFVDSHDENMFWSNDEGIFRYNFSAKRTDTLFRNCETVIYDRPMQGKQNEITLSKHIIRVTHPYYLVHEYKAVEYNYVLKEERTVKVF